MKWSSLTTQVTDSAHDKHKEIAFSWQQNPSGARKETCRAHKKKSMHNTQFMALITHFEVGRTKTCYQEYDTLRNTHHFEH